MCSGSFIYYNCVLECMTVKKSRVNTSNFKSATPSKLISNTKRSTLGGRTYGKKK